MFKVLQGDCREVMFTLEVDSVDAIVTDPPYELGFMGKSWDASGVAFDPETWRHALRVLKPGGHLLAFSGSRTYHRMACAIEDAGFEIRDQIMWVYGSGFPKSHDVSKAIDKRGGNANLTSEIGAALKAARNSRGISITEADRKYCSGATLWSWYEGRPAGQQMPTADMLHRIASDWPELQSYADATSEAEREILAQVKGSRLVFAPGQDNDISDNTLYVTAPSTDSARTWSGWGTALKPAHEPIVVARKPFKGTVAANVMAHGTGALNIDGCRVGEHLGRWPANFIHDGSDEATSGLGDAARFFYCPKASKRDREDGLDDHDDRILNRTNPGGIENDPKWAPRVRKNNHPTVKPTDLMRYLCRLVTPPGGLVLDPFTGSGSTGRGAVLEGFRFLGIEMDPGYMEIAIARIESAERSSPHGAT